MCVCVCALAGGNTKLVSEVCNYQITLGICYACRLEHVDDHRHFDKRIDGWDVLMVGRCHDDFQFLANDAYQGKDRWFRYACTKGKRLMPSFNISFLQKKSSVLSKILRIQQYLRHWRQCHFALLSRNARTWPPNVRRLVLWLQAVPPWTLRGYSAAFYSFLSAHVTCVNE